MDEARDHWCLSSATVTKSVEFGWDRVTLLSAKVASTSFSLIKQAATLEKTANSALSCVERKFKSSAGVKAVSAVSFENTVSLLAVELESECTS